MEKEAPIPTVLGGQERFMVLSGQTLALDYLVYGEHLWSLHCGLEHHVGKTQSLHKCITRRECSHLLYVQYVSKYATHMYLHKCRIIGLLQRWKKSVET